MVVFNLMNELQEQLEEWMNSGENEHLEFKEAQNQYDFEKLVRYSAALANEGGGRIILGVTDQKPRQVVGTRAYRNLEKMLHRIKAGTTAQIALASIPVLGEDFSSKPMRRVREYNKNLQAIARMEGVTYLPVFERQRDYLVSKDEAARLAYSGSVMPTLQLAWRIFLTGSSFDSYSREMGYTLLTDGVHMNTTGAQLIADVIYEFLEGVLEEDKQLETAG